MFAQVLIESGCNEQGDKVLKEIEAKIDKYPST